MCVVCGRPIAGPRLTDPQTGVDFHPACLAQRATHDAVVALIAATVLLLAPSIVVWAG